MSQMVVKPRYLRHFATCSWLEGIAKEMKETYWEKNVHNIHYAEDHVGDFRLVVAITGEYQARRDNVVGEHLPMVLPPLLNVDDHDLLQPECILDEDVPF